MKQVEKDYINLVEKYNKLKKHAVRNDLAISLLINIFNKPKLKNSDERKRKVFEGVEMLMMGYYKSIVKHHQFDDVEEMINTANKFFQELEDETKNEAIDFVKKFVKETN